MKTIYFEADKYMENIIEQIKHEIVFGKYEIRSWNQFIESAILVFQKLLENNISPEKFDLFIDYYYNVTKDYKKFDA